LAVSVFNAQKQLDRVSYMSALPFLTSQLKIKYWKSMKTALKIKSQGHMLPKSNHI